ncbi:MAG: Fe-S cluster biogenesis protein NfuA [Kiritimatiellia bacterium]|jgi:Fe-S cluster biogenesis protein NfuA
MSEEEPVKIRGEFTPDPTVCNFNINRPILEDADLTVSFLSAADAEGSPLAAAIFGIEGVGRLSIKGSTMSITKDSDDAWPKLASQMIPMVKALFEAGGPYVSAAKLEELDRVPPEEDMARIIQDLLDVQVNPYLASHGGFVKLHRVDGRDVHVEMGGGCQGCSASRQTMKHGVERAIREAIPQVREVIDATDHSAGANPYYK